MRWNIFKKRPSPLDQLKVDMHSHLIPGLDDGVRSMADSLACIEALSKLGYEKVITTPHVMGDYYPNSRNNIEEGFLTVKHELERTGSAMDFSVAAEYFLDDFFLDLLKSEEPLLTLDGNLVLVELSTFIKSNHVLDTLFQLQARGYRPVLAHPERYLYYAKDIDFMIKLKEIGCLFQTNILSLFGHYGNDVRKFGIELLRRKMVDCLGTDLHHIEHAKKLQEAKRSKTPKVLQSYFMRNNDLFYSDKSA